jgi:integrase
VLRRVLQVAVEKQKIPSNQCDRVHPPRVPKREMVFLSWEEVVDLAEAMNERYRALIYMAVDSRMRWSELVGLRRAKVDLGRRKVRVTEQLVRLEAGGVATEGAQDGRRHAVDHHLGRDRSDRLRAHRAGRGAGPRCTGLPERGQHAAALVELLAAPLPAGPEGGGARLPLPRPAAHERGAGHSGRCPPKAIQSRMGHSSINVTLDRYGHLFPELDEAIATSFGEHLATVGRLRHAGQLG